MRLILPGLFLLFHLSSIAQDSFKDGYLVKLNNDTIRGQLKDEPEEELSNRVTFKSSDGTIETFTQQNIKAFGFEKGSIFRIVKYIDPSDNNSNKEHFAKLLFDGINDLFSFIRKDKVFFVARAKEDTTLLLYDDFKTGFGQVSEPGNFRGQLFYIGRDCEKARTDAGTVYYSEKALLNYFISLDKCLGGNGDASAVYYQKPKGETHAYLFAGGLPLGKESEIVVQGTFRFVLPFQSRKTSLNINLVYLHSKHTETYRDAWALEHEYGHIADIIDLPITIQYDILDKRIRPYFYGGLGPAYINESYENYTKSDGQTEFGLALVGGAGVEGYLLRNVFLKADWRYDFVAHYPVIGIGLKIK